MKQSAGILVFRRTASALELLLAHPGGPFWAKKDLGAWTIPKGEVGDGEDPLAAARRELEEETGYRSDGPFLPLGVLRQSSAKRVHVWAVEENFDESAFRSGTFEMEWPPRSGRQQAFPEIDRVQWFPPDEARRRLLKGQMGLVDQLEAILQNERPAEGS